MRKAVGLLKDYPPLATVALAAAVVLHWLLYDAVSLFPDVAGRMAHSDQSWSVYLGFAGIIPIIAGFARGDCGLRAWVPQRQLLPPALPRRRPPRCELAVTNRRLAGGRPWQRVVRLDRAIGPWPACLVVVRVLVPIVGDFGTPACVAVRAPHRRCRRGRPSGWRAGAKTPVAGRSPPARRWVTRSRAVASDMLSGNDSPNQHSGPANSRDSFASAWAYEFDLKG